MSVFGERIFNIILRGLSFPHTDNFIIKSIEILTHLLRADIIPDKVLDFLYLYLIHTFNQDDKKCSYLEKLRDFAKILLTKTDSFIKFF